MPTTLASVIWSDNRERDLMQTDEASRVRAVHLRDPSCAGLAAGCASWQPSGAVCLKHTAMREIEQVQRAMKKRPTGQVDDVPVWVSKQMVRITELHPLTINLCTRNRVLST